MDQFFLDVKKGLSSSPKYLLSKYFYDKAGDLIFEQIMRSQDYYLTRCEHEIFEEHSPTIARFFNAPGGAYDIIELGAGDASKTSHLLQHLVDERHDFTYYPIDISSQVIENLETKLPEAIPGIKVKGLNGEYFPMLRKAAELSKRRKVILFLGSNIGNMFPDEATTFCRTLHHLMGPMDLLLMGVDLKKNPRTILRAYDDEEGLTRDFNLNLLHRINEELNANFCVDDFEHYQTYDPETGSCKSYLISAKSQKVRIGPDREVFSFKRDESIFMEVSQKYDSRSLRALANSSGFLYVEQFYDPDEWFTDVLWLKRPENSTDEI